MPQTYSFWKSLGKLVVKGGVLLLPTLLSLFPQWANLTLGGAGYLILDALQKKYTAL